VGRRTGTGTAIRREPWGVVPWMTISLGARLAAVALCLAAVPDALPAQSVTPAPLRHAEITFAMKATKVADFVGRVDTVQAQFTGTSLATVTGSVEFRLRDMHTGIGLRDTHMRNAMRADSFPTIHFALTGLDVGTATGDSTAVVFHGALTIHGVTRNVRVPGTVVIRGNEVDIASFFPIDMREYGIAPPSRFLGAVKVDPMAGIGVRLTFGG
jgi:polyisoprenoid-binding protein YceI